MARIRELITAALPTPLAVATLIAVAILLSACEEAPAEEPSCLEELEMLAALRDQGVMSDEDFEAKKNRLLGL